MIKHQKTIGVTTATTAAFLILLLQLTAAMAQTTTTTTNASTTTTSGTLSMTGQRFLPEGTGIAYFNDGTMAPFEHKFTPEEGYYYDNSTVFVYGQVEGYESNNTIWELNAQARARGEYGSVTGDTINVTISNGAEFLGDRAIQPSKIIKAKVGDILVWTNEDFNSHNIQSPPNDFSGISPQGGNFEMNLGPGENSTLVLTKAVGMHYNDVYNPELKGAIIVEER